MTRSELIEKRRGLWFKIEEIRKIMWEKKLINKDKLEEEYKRLKKKYEFYSNMLKNMKGDKND